MVAAAAGQDRAWPLARPALPPPEARELGLGHRPRAAARGAGRAGAARPPGDAGAQRPRRDQAAARRAPSPPRMHGVSGTPSFTLARRGGDEQLLELDEYTAAELGAPRSTRLLGQSQDRSPVALADCGPVRYACSRKVSGLRSESTSRGATHDHRHQQQLPAATWSVDNDPLDRELRGQVHGLDLPHRVRSLRGDARHDRGRAAPVRLRRSVLDRRQGPELPRPPPVAGLLRHRAPPARSPSSRRPSASTATSSSSTAT